MNNRTRAHQIAAQRIREARQALNDIPRTDKRVTDYVYLFVLGVVEEIMIESDGPERDTTDTGLSTRSDDGDERP